MLERIALSGYFFLIKINCYSALILILNSNLTIILIFNNFNKIIISTYKFNLNINLKNNFKENKLVKSLIGYY